ncbi:tRNA (guanine(26)-N(2))-dimethyltransferase [Halotydeus destructor]|nr:tRNA (guanine(26)-N(2))-dimethyltransferase [Halotydeus destructor]
MSVLCMNTFIENEMWTKAKYGNIVGKRGIKILDALSATGLRSIRYAKELETQHSLKVFANDISEKAVETIKKNVEHNGVTEKVTIVNEDASTLMYQNRKYDERYTILDLDPYGSPAPFIDAAVQSVGDGGMLMVTCTDLAILCGNHSETCFAKYGAMSFRFPACHEMALRIILRSVESSANRYGRYIVPLLSMSADFYIRLFMQVFTSQLKTKQSPSKTGYVYLCQGCQSISIQPVGRFEQTGDGDNPKCDYSIGKGPVVNRNCDHCQRQHLIGGPIWIGPIHSQEFLANAACNLYSNASKYKTFKRMEGMVQVMKEELPDVPLFQSLDELSRIVHCSSPPMKLLRSALLNAGYAVSSSHCNKNSIKTDAPNTFIWEIMRKWVEEHPIEKSKWNESSDSGLKILAKSCSSDISFEYHQDAEPLSKKKEMVRYQVNPEPNWGPKSRASARSTPEAKKIKLDADSNGEEIK